MNFRRLFLFALLASTAIGLGGFGAGVETTSAAEQDSGTVFRTLARQRVSWANPGEFSKGGYEGPLSWSVRVITEKELDRLGQKDLDLSPSYAKRLLARLNVRDFDYIDQDIRNGRPIKVPSDFRLLKTWTPLPGYIPEMAGTPKFILIAKDLSYIGWYENGRMAGNTYICIGREDDWTRAGLYTVKEKDIDHVSRSYPNAWGEPSPMPWALRIYETVWIHAGDIERSHCSHGCINLPIFPAQKLFDWARTGTPVLIVESMRDVPTVMAKNKSDCSLFASACSGPATTKVE